jgi:hypothetical protein
MLNISLRPFIIFFTCLVWPHFGFLQLSRHARDRHRYAEVLPDGRRALQERGWTRTMGRTHDGGSLRLQVREKHNLYNFILWGQINKIAHPKLDDN